MPGSGSGENLTCRSPGVTPAKEATAQFRVSDVLLRGQRPVPISISGLSSRFGISRVHVRTLLRDAEAAGLIERPEGHVVLRPALREGILSFFAAVALYVAYCVLKASEDARRAK